MTIELYVYYKADRALAARVREAVGRHEGVRLLLRADGSEAQTWMEIHSGPNAEQTAQQVEQALADLPIGARHVERFAPPA